MFGAKRTSEAAKLLHINFSAETVTERNYVTLKEYCHVTFEQNGWVQHMVLDAAGVKFTKNPDVIEPQINISTNALSGVAKGAEIILPENCTFNML